MATLNLENIAPKTLNYDAHSSRLRLSFALLTPGFYIQHRGPRAEKTRTVNTSFERTPHGLRPA